MKTWKHWQLLALVLPAYLYGFGSAVELEQCIHTVKNSPCNITCKVTDSSQLIEFTCNGTTRGSCSIFSCSSNMIKEGNDTMHFQISALSYSDNCRWICTYNGIPSPPSDIQIYSGVNVPPVLTIQKNADEVELKATAECIYPYSPTVVVQYKDQTGGDYISLSDQVLLQISNVSENCSADIEKRITAIYVVSGEQYAGLQGKNVLFKMKFTQYPSAIPVYSNDIQFSFQDCSLDIILCGLLPVFLIVLTVSIVFIIILKKECLPKQFGELTKKKLGIIVAFILVAIIIGVCLGLLIKGCDKKFLALGLSILFAIIIVVAFILTLFFYHKKFESRRGSQGGQGQDNNGDNRNNTSSTATKAPIGRTRESQNNTGSNTTKNATERVGSPASTSNIELSAKNKAGVPKGEQSALKQKEINTPLPSPPSQPPTAFAYNLPLSRTNQLPPLAKENEEANTTEKKKKKKKKRRKKSEEAGENVDKIQDDDNDN